MSNNGQEKKHPLQEDKFGFSPEELDALFADENPISINAPFAKIEINDFGETNEEIQDQIDDIYNQLEGFDETIADASNRLDAIYDFISAMSDHNPEKSEKKPCKCHEQEPTLTPTPEVNLVDLRLQALENIENERQNTWGLLLLAVMFTLLGMLIVLKFPKYFKLN